MLSQDFKDMLVLFEEEKVEYIIVGAYALSAHGIVRATRDIDFWVNPTPENADKVWRALTRFGAPMIDVTVDDFARPGVIYQIGVAPFRIDVITEAAPLKFEASYANAIRADIGGVQAPVLSVGDIILNKQTAGRHKDELDIEELRKHYKI